MNQEVENGDGRRKKLCRIILQTLKSASINHDVIIAPGKHLKFQVTLECHAKLIYSKCPLLTLR